MILTASGYSGGGAFIFLHAPAVVAGAFLFLPCAVWRPLRLSTAFFFPGIYFHSLLRFFQCAPRVAFVRLSPHISAGCMVLSAALYRTFAALRYAHSRPILQPVPGLRCAAPLRPWGGCTLAPAAPEGATPQAVPVSGSTTPPVLPSGGFWGRRGGGPGPSMAGGVPGVFGRGRPIFFGGCPDRSARASGWVCLPAPKSLGQSRKVESR